MNSLQYNSHISVGRWVKKASDPATIALIGATTVFIIKPVWEDLYKTQLAPKIYKFVSENYDKLKSKNIGMDLIQTVNFNGNDIQIIMIPIRGQEKECYHVEYIDKAMKLVNLHLYKECSDKDVGKIYLYFHDYNSGFKLHKIELVNGEVIYYL